MAARQVELLPIPYFHVVFTLPKQFRPLALQNKRIVYDILFRAAAETLKVVAAIPRARLRATVDVAADRGRDRGCEGLWPLWCRFGR